MGRLKDSGKNEKKTIHQTIHEGELGVFKRFGHQKLIQMTISHESYIKVSPFFDNLTQFWVGEL